MRNQKRAVITQVHTNKYSTATLDTALGGKCERTPVSGCQSVVGISL